MEKGNMEGARIHAQNAIRNKTQALNYLRLGARIDSVASKLESAIKMQQVTKTMGSVVKGMDKALASMNIEQISAVMEKFEQQFEDMDVKSEYIEGAMSGATSGVMPEEQVDSLMQQVADEHGLKMADQFSSAVPGAALGGRARRRAGGGGGGRRRSPRPTPRSVCASFATHEVLPNCERRQAVVRRRTRDRRVELLTC